MTEQDGVLEEMTDKKTTPIGNWTDEPCWYVTAIDEGKTALVLGPFRAEADCRKYAFRDPSDGGNDWQCGKLRKLAYELDPKSWFYAWGMIRREDGRRDGGLNSKMRTDGLWTGEDWQ